MKDLAPTAVSLRHYEAADITNLENDWYSSNVDANDGLRFILRRVRNRARDMERNNPTIRRFVQLMDTNILGPDGIRLRSTVQDAPQVKDAGAIRVIEAAWKEFEMVADVTGHGSLRDAAGEFLRRWFVDGEAIARILIGDFNEFGVAVQILDPDTLDETKNRIHERGRNDIRMGVEQDQWGRPVRYYFRKDEGYYTENHVVLGSDYLIHDFMRERPAQSRGVTWLAPTMQRERMHHAFEQAIVIGSRVAASKMGFFLPNQDRGYTGAGRESDGTTSMSCRPGEFETLPMGLEFQSFDPGYPPANFDSFQKAVKKSIAAGLGVNYTALASDLEGTNYSSIRAGSLEDRDLYRTFQNRLARVFYRPLFLAWLETGMLTGAIPLPVTKYEKFRRHEWRGRGWDWVDPLKQEKANETALANKTTSRRRICDRLGVDFDEIASELKQEREMLGIAGE